MNRDFFITIILAAALCTNLSYSALRPETPPQEATNISDTYPYPRPLPYYQMTNLNYAAAMPHHNEQADYAQPGIRIETKAEKDAKAHSALVAQKTSLAQLEKKQSQVTKFEADPFFPKNFPKELQQLIKEYLIHPLHYAPALYRYIEMSQEQYNAELKVAASLAQNNNDTFITKIMREDVICEGYETRAWKDKVYLCNTKTNATIELFATDKTNPISDGANAIITPYGIIIIFTLSKIYFYNCDGMFINAIANPIPLNRWNPPTNSCAREAHTVHILSDRSIVITPQQVGPRESVEDIYIIQQESFDGEFTITATFRTCICELCTPCYSRKNPGNRIITNQYDLLFKSACRPVWKINQEALQVLQQCSFETLDILQILLKQLLKAHGDPIDKDLARFHKNYTLTFTPKHLAMLAKLPPLIQRQIAQYFEGPRTGFERPRPAAPPLRIPVTTVTAAP